MPGLKLYKVTYSKDAVRSEAHLQTRGEPTQFACGETKELVLTEQQVANLEREPDWSLRAVPKAKVKPVAKPKPDDSHSGSED